MLAQWLPCWQEFCVSHSSSIFLRNGNLILNFSLNVHIDIFSLLQPKMVLEKWKKGIVHLLHTVNNIYCARVLRLLSIYSVTRLLSLFPIYIHLTYLSWATCWSRPGPQNNWLVHQVSGKVNRDIWFPSSKWVRGG